jgi:hypothetical protein
MTYTDPDWYVLGVGGGEAGGERAGQGVGVAADGDGTAAVKLRGYVDVLKKVGLTPRPA